MAAKETTLSDTIKEKANVAKEKLIDTYGDVKVKSGELCNQSGEFIKDRAKVVDDKVHNSPWPVVGGAFVTGLLLGYILGRK
jgi:ElaB/YqjD/DUF883 family membrane-anchored ribosome-binding protein